VNIAEKIKEARSQAGLSQRQLAEAVGVTVRAVRFWEAGQREPHWSLIVRIARATGQPLVYFTDGSNAR
jgi:transcriptional regulator with XRE-family HTH domain